MKKLFLLLFILANATVLFGQIDSTQVVNFLHNGGNLANQVFPDRWIPFVSNDAVIGFVTALGGAIMHRIGTIRIWRKKGKLN